MNRAKPVRKRRRVRFSNVPHRRRAFDALLEPLICFANIGVGSWLYPAWRNVRVRWEPDVSALIALLKARSRPIICFAWHKYELLATCAVKHFPKDAVPLAVGHDGLLSRALQQSGIWCNIPVWVYRRRSPVRPKDQLVDLLTSEQAAIGLFPDSGGPDGRIRKGFVDVARQSEALLIPMAFQARPVLTARSRRSYCIPLPFSRIRAYYGKPIDGSLTTHNDCRQALEVFERKIHAGAEPALSKEGRFR